MVRDDSANGRSGYPFSADETRVHHYRADECTRIAECSRSWFQYIFPNTGCSYTNRRIWAKSYRIEICKLYIAYYMRNSQIRRYKKIYRHNLRTVEFTWHIFIFKPPDVFPFSLYELNWDVFNTHVEAMNRLMPTLATAGIKTTVCGPESFTPDHRPIMGKKFQRYSRCNINALYLKLILFKKAKTHGARVFITPVDIIALGWCLEAVVGNK